MLLAVVVVGVIAYQALQDGADQAVQLRENIRGNVQDAVDEVKGLIEDNTRSVAAAPANVNGGWVGRVRPGGESSPLSHSRPPPRHPTLPSMRS